MIKRKKSLFFIIIIGLCTHLSFPTKNQMHGEDSTERYIQLQEAIENGIKIDLHYQNRQIDAEMAELERQKAKFKKFFSLDFAASYLFKSQQMEISFPAMSPVTAAVTTGNVIKAGAKNNFDFKLSLVQPLFTGNILSNSVEIEKFKKMRENYNVDLRKIEISGAIKSSYFTYKLLKSKQKSLKLLMKNLKLHLKRITDFYNEDLIKKTDLLETKIKLAESKIKISDLNQLIEEEKINFKKLCDFNVEDIEKNYDEKIESFEDSLKFLINRHPVLRVIDENRKIMELRKKLVSGSYLPHLNGFAELHYGKPGIDFFKNEWSVYFQGGLNINWNIFDWNQKKQDKKILDMSIQKLTNNKKDIVDDASKKLRQLYSKKRSLENQLELVEQLVSSSSEDVLLKKEMYNEQQISNLDYLSAMLEKESYQTRKSEVSIQISIVKLNINALIGRIGGI